MKILMFGIALFLATGTPGQSARNYYDELYKAAGLDRMADQYVCFDDDPALETFFIFAKSDTLKQFLSDNGGYEKLPAKSKRPCKKGFSPFVNMTRAYRFPPSPHTPKMKARLG